MAETKVTSNEITSYGWQTATLVNGWVVYDADTAYGSARYRKDELGNVYVNLMIKNGTTTAETNVTTLPVGYRPPIRTIFAGVANNALCRFDILANGEVKVVSGAHTSYTAITAMFKAA